MYQAIQTKTTAEPVNGLADLIALEKYARPLFQGITWIEVMVGTTRKTADGTRALLNGFTCPQLPAKWRSALSRVNFVDFRGPETHVFF